MSRKGNRVPMKRSKDANVFKHTASKGKAINIFPRNSRGGTYL